MAIEILKVHEGDTGAGLFNLPMSFDRKRYAACWKKVGQEVTAAQQREVIASLGLTADGWEVFKDNGKICKVATKKDGEYVLMFRPREIQDAVNALYGNESKRRLLVEKRGETIGGKPVEDPGLLNERVLEQSIGKEGQDLDGEVSLNKVEISHGATRKAVAAGSENL